MKLFVNCNELSFKITFLTQQKLIYGDNKNEERGRDGEMRRRKRLSFFFSYSLTAKSDWHSIVIFSIYFSSAFLIKILSFFLGFTSCTCTHSAHMHACGRGNGHHRKVSMRFVFSRAKMPRGDSYMCMCVPLCAYLRVLKLVSRLPSANSYAATVIGKLMRHSIHKHTHTQMNDKHGDGCFACDLLSQDRLLILPKK